jgi:hypothetical protein
MLVHVESGVGFQLRYSNLLSPRKYYIHPVFLQNFSVSFYKIIFKIQIALIKFSS